MFLIIYQLEISIIYPLDNVKFYNFDLKNDWQIYWPMINAISIYHLAANADVRGGDK